MVCGDTWQEAKLMFDTFIKLFQVAIELRRVGRSPRRQEISEGDISIVHETTSSSASAKKVLKKAKSMKARQAKLPTDLRTKKVEDRPLVDREAVKRKKLALLRLRERTSGASSRRTENMSSRRRNAASFMEPDSGPHREEVNSMNMMRQMQTGMTSFNNAQMQYNNTHNMAFPGMNMGMNQINMSGMNMGMCNPNAGNMMMMNQSPGMFLNSMEEAREERPRLRGPRGGRRTVKGNVKERLGFKSNISVDPVLLSEDNIDEEDY